MHVQACTGGKLAGMQAVKENDQSGSDSSYAYHALSNPQQKAPSYGCPLWVPFLIICNVLVLLLVYQHGVY